MEEVSERDAIQDGMVIHNAAEHRFDLPYRENRIDLLGLRRVAARTPGGHRPDEIAGGSHG